MNWILLVLLLAFVALALAGWLAAWHTAREDQQVTRQRDHLASRNAELATQLEQLQEDMHRLDDALAAQITMLQEEMHRMDADNELFVQTIDALQKEVARLQQSAGHATMPIVKTTPVPKRPTRKKAGTP